LAVEDWRILLKLGLWKLTHPLFNVYYLVESGEGTETRPYHCPPGYHLDVQ
jgi:hypothetical protein